MDKEPIAGGVIIPIGFRGLKKLGKEKTLDLVGQLLEKVEAQAKVIESAERAIKWAEARLDIRGLRDEYMGEPVWDNIPTQKALAQIAELEKTK